MLLCLWVVQGHGLVPVLDNFADDIFGIGVAEAGER